MHLLNVSSLTGRWFYWRIIYLINRMGFPLERFVQDVESVLLNLSGLA